MSAKDDAARRLIEWHFWIEPDMVEIYRFRAPHEEEPNEPIKLLEVNAATVATGSVQPFAFTGEREIPFPSVVAEVTPEELLRIERGEISMPKGWALKSAERHLRPGKTDAAE